MRISFVFPNVYTPYSHSPAIQALSAFLKREGNSISLVHLNSEHAVPDDDSEFIKELEKQKPELVAFTSTSFEYDRSNELAGIAKKYLKVPAILGGVHATTKQDDFSSSNFDAFCVGEGELVLSRIAKSQLIPRGVIYGETIKDLDSLPFYDWDIMDTEKFLGTKGRWLNIGFSRGCPFKCTFCANPVLRLKRDSKMLRRRSVQNALSELEYVLERFEISTFNFDDDLFTLNKKWVAEFSSEYRKRIYEKSGIEYVVEARADVFDEELAHNLKVSGCREVQFGIETGSQKLRDFIKKGINEKQIKSAFQLCREYELNTYAYMILGIPGECKETYDETVSLMAEIRPRLIRPTFLCPVYGTELFDYCRKNNLLKEEKVRVWNSESSLRLDTISESDLMRCWLLFPWNINLKMGLESYRSAISEFGILGYDSLKSQQIFCKILEMDKVLDHQHRGTPHYRYHPEEGKDREARFNRFEISN